MEKYMAQFDACREKEGPACEAVCPFSFDIFSFLEKASRGSWDRAYKIYRDGVLFPDIVARLCSAPCAGACVRKDVDGAVQMKLLEQTCIERVNKKEPVNYRLPPRKETIGIIGAGPEGMACAAALSAKNYSVTVFEKEHTAGGQLAMLLPEEVYLGEFARQIKEENCRLETDCEIRELTELDSYQFNYIYQAAEAQRKDAVTAIAEGIRAARQIELFFKTGRRMEERGKEKAFFVPDRNGIVRCEPVCPRDSVFTDEEARTEADRCIRCQCGSCRQDCDLSDFYQKWPSEMKEEIATTVMPSHSMIHKVYAQMIHSCTQCGKMEKNCPVGIELGALFLEARKSMHKQGKIPPAYHGFWLADMRHANSQECRICRNAPGTTQSQYVFFPGCNLGADEPQYVLRLYGWLTHHFKGVGILISCCGIHSEWAGDETLSQESLSQIRSEWNALGKPRFLTACPACQNYLNRVLPEARPISVYELMEAYGKWPLCKDKDSTGLYSIFDPCMANDNQSLKHAVRKSLNTIGIFPEELPKEQHGGCCGFGGDIREANPEFAEYLARKRTSGMNSCCVTYCVNCRDIFADTGKTTIHVLDLLFGIHAPGRKGTDYTERRKNREMLKQRLLKEYWSEDAQISNEGKEEEELEFSGEICSKMKRLRLHEKQIQEVIKKSKALNRRIFNKNKNEYICYSRLDYITCWVCYEEQGSKFYVKNVYTHRMNIKLEEVWNGRKVEPDL